MLRSLIVRHCRKEIDRSVVWSCCVVEEEDDEKEKKSLFRFAGIDRVRPAARLK